MKINREQWQTERKAIEQRIKEHKERMRERFQPRWYKDGFTDYSLQSAKLSATNLYMARAAARGKIHLKDQTEEQTAEALEYAKDFEVLETPDKAA